MRLDLRHPTEKRLRAAVGFDRATGYWATVRRSGRSLGELDALQGHPADLSSVLHLLIDHGFISWDDVEQAKRLLPVRELLPSDPPGTQLAALVLENLKHPEGEEA